MISPDKELFVWGPIDGRPIYTSYFIVIMYQKPKYTYHWPEFLFYFSKTKMTLIADYTDLRNAGKKSFTKWIMDDKNLKKLETDYKAARKELRDIEKTITKKHLDSLSEKQFNAMFQKWNSLYLKFWTVGLVPELSNWGGEQILKEELHKIIENEAEFLRLFEKLTAPEDYSFYQKEELNLLKIKEMSKNKKAFNQLLNSHCREYFWINNSYFEQKILGHNYFRKQLKKIKSSEAKIKIKKIMEIPAKTLKQKMLISRDYNLDKDIMKIAKRLSYSIWWQDARKEQIFTSNHYIDLFLRQISWRKKVRFLDLKYYSGDDLAKLMKDGKKVNTSIINQRKRKCLFHYHKRSLVFETGEKIMKKVNPFLKKEVNKDTDSIKGMVVSFGKKSVKGKVRILLTPRNVNKMKKGEILVAPMTSPDFVVAMRKAAAVITDEGGMTSHAAIVSRELGIPCIVGAKIATKSLKNGMLIEVDTDKGIVRKIK